jgi:hypothetical protein
MGVSGVRPENFGSSAAGHSSAAQGAFASLRPHPHQSSYDETYPPRRGRQWRRPDRTDPRLRGWRAPLPWNRLRLRLPRRPHPHPHPPQRLHPLRPLHPRLPLSRPVRSSRRPPVLRAIALSIPPCSRAPHGLPSRRASLAAGPSGGRRVRPTPTSTGTPAGCGPSPAATGSIATARARAQRPGRPLRPWRVRRPCRCPTRWT